MMLRNSLELMILVLFQKLVLGDHFKSKRPTVITSKPANGSGSPGLRMFYPAAGDHGRVGDHLVGRF